MRKLIALAFSDLHISDWAKFNNNYSRTLNHFRVLSILKERCVKHNIPLLFCGDLLHKPETISQDLISLLMYNFSKLEDARFRCYAISGNHDQCKLSSIKDPSPSWVNLFSEYFNWLNVIDFDWVDWVYQNVIVHGVPYIEHNVGLGEYLKNLNLESGYKHILLLHTDYPGAKDCDGRVVDSVENLNINMLNRFDLVLCGHIHKPQRLSKKVYMLGAPLQQRRTDRGNQLGYWEIYSDMSVKFKPLEGFPQFIDVETEDEIKDDGNYYTVIPKKTSIEVNTKHKITKQLSKKTLAKKYLRERGIKDKGRKELLITLLQKSEQ